MDLFDFICNKLEFLTREGDKRFNYAYILGKLYSFYYNFGSASIEVEEKTILFSNKILHLYQTSRIVINELILIKVNLFKDFLVTSKNKISESLKKYF